MIMNNIFHRGEILHEELLFNARNAQCNARYVGKRIEQAYENFKEEKQSLVNSAV